MSEMERVKSGIEGLDELIEGGFPRGFCYAIIGGPGAGKTIFGVQFLYHGITRYGENGIYVTLEEPPYSIANNMMRFGWNLYDLENREKLALVDASPIRISQSRYAIKSTIGTEDFSIDGLLGVIVEAKRKINAKRCVIDSLRALTLQYRDEFEMRQQILKMIRALNEMKLTTLLITESSEERVDAQRFDILEFLAQGVIYLHTYRVRDNIIRAIEVRKMRGTKITDKICPYVFTNEGIVVYPQETVFR
ncbi:hypothetical protein J7L29_04160 [Candidatus Bathyarchaeota archaeon]|nr:hypothetical protein [Candidatus Bathyarchaeota archaeon]